MPPSRSLKITSCRFTNAALRSTVRITQALCLWLIPSPRSSGIEGSSLLLSAVDADHLLCCPTRGPEEVPGYPVTFSSWELYLPGQLKFQECPGNQSSRIPIPGLLYGEFLSWEFPKVPVMHGTRSLCAHNDSLNSTTKVPGHARILTTLAFSL